VSKKQLAGLFILVIALSLFYSLSLNVSATGTCTLTDKTAQKNCVEIHATITGPNGKTVPTPYDNKFAIVNSNYTTFVDGSGNIQKQTFTALDFQTNKCSIRGVWHIQVDVYRWYYDSAGVEKKDEAHLTKDIIFYCNDWTPPKISINKDDANYKTGVRKVRIDLSDNETSKAPRGYLIAGTPDNTVLRKCYYKVYSSKPSKPAAGTDFSSWTEISCTGNMSITQEIEITPQMCKGDCYIAVAAYDNATVNGIGGTDKSYGNLGWNYTHLDSVYTAINNQGYCHLGPANSLCYVSTGKEANLSSTNFTALFSQPEGTDVWNSGLVPQCVTPGSWINNMYCDNSQGMVPKGKELFDYTGSYASSSGSHYYEYCAPYNRIVPGSGGFNVMPYNASIAPSQNLTHVCVLNDLHSNKQLVAMSLDRIKVPAGVGINFKNLYGSKDFTFHTEQNSRCPSNKGGTFYTCNQDNATLNLTSGIMTLGNMFLPAIKPLEQPSPVAEESMNMISAVESVMSGSKYQDYLQTKYGNDPNVLHGVNYIFNETAYDFIAVQRNGSKTALGFSVKVYDLQYQPEYLVGAYYTGFTPSDLSSLCSYSHSVGLPSYALVPESIYCDNDGKRLIVVAMASDYSQGKAAEGVERLIARLRI